MDDRRPQAIDMLNEGMADLASAAKLPFTFSTGAVVLFVHESSEFHRMPTRAGILSLATLFFGFSAGRCIRALVRLSRIKLALGDTIWRDMEKSGDFFRERAQNDANAAINELVNMEHLFYAGVG